MYVISFVLCCSLVCFKFTSSSIKKLRTCYNGAFTHKKTYSASTMFVTVDGKNGTGKNGTGEKLGKKDIKGKNCFYLKITFIIF